ncbi:MAG: alpha-L-arabinofuranosidase A [Burkholderiales bacterium]
MDEHYYMAPKWFFENTTRYDKYDRNGPKVFAGEYAAQTAGMTREGNHNNWAAAIAEAAFMTGLERNGDVVTMASYAPLMVNVNAWQWRPDAIWFDNLRSFGTPNYYVQSVYANNVGTRVVPIAPFVSDELYTSATIDERTHELIVKTINNSSEGRSTSVHLRGGRASGTVRVITLASADLNAENSFERPKAVVPVESNMKSAEDLEVDLKPYSLTVFRIQIQ